MKKALILSTLILLTVVGAGLFIKQPAAYAAFEGSKEQACQGVNLGSSGACDDTSATSANRLIAVGLNIFSVVIGVIAVIMIMVGGLKFVTASGDSNNVSSARNTILYAVIGLVVVALAQIIVHFVLNRIPS